MASEATGLLDSNILIDIIRRYPPAVKWIGQSEDQALAIPSVARMELVLGTKNKVEQQKVTNYLARYPLLFPTESDAQWAMAQFEVYHLSHQIEIIDCFIAAMGARLELPIYSRNVKDFGVFDQIMVIAPY